MFVYTPDFLPSSIVLIGAGGTGSRLMPPLAQLIRTCIRTHNPTAWMERLPLFVVDGDEVEEKNLLRQNFIRKDVGKNKASVVASRYANAFDIPIYSSNQFIKEGVNLKWNGADPSVRLSFANSLVILAVDSAQARRDILDYIVRGPVGIGETGKCFVIDAGNEDAFGQVKFFTLKILAHSSYDRNLSKHLERLPINSPVEVPVDFIPYDPAYYRDLGSSAAELSCADLPQTLAINNMMAALICSVVQNFLYLKPVKYDGIRFGMDGSLSTEFNTPRRWMRRSVDVDKPREQHVRQLQARHLHDTFAGGSIFTRFEAELTKFLKSSYLMVGPNGDLIPDVIALETKRRKEEAEAAEKARLAEERKAELKRRAEARAAEKLRAEEAAAQSTSQESVPEVTLEVQVGESSLEVEAVAAPPLVATPLAREERSETPERVEVPNNPPPLEPVRRPRPRPRAGA